MHSPNITGAFQLQVLFRKETWATNSSARNQFNCEMGTRTLLSWIELSAESSWKCLNWAGVVKHCSNLGPRRECSWNLSLLQYPPHHGPEHLPCTITYKSPCTSLTIMSLQSHWIPVATRQTHWNCEHGKPSSELFYYVIYRPIVVWFYCSLIQWLYLFCFDVLMYQGWAMVDPVIQR